MKFEAPGFCLEKLSRFGPLGSEPGDGRALSVSVFPLPIPISAFQINVLNFLVDWRDQHN